MIIRCPRKDCIWRDVDNQCVNPSEIHLTEIEMSLLPEWEAEDMPLNCEEYEVS